MPGFSQIAWLFVMSLFLYGCGGTSRAPVDVLGGTKSKAPTVTNASKKVFKKPAKYVVKSGDTLYAIAWRYGLDYRKLAAWNHIPHPYVIQPGQPLNLKAARSRNITKKQPSSTQKKRTIKQPKKQLKKVQYKKITRWYWPASGTSRQVNTKAGKLGLEIYGKRGQPIHATAHGKVVYVGSGLLGYGRLIIVEHNDVYLSAYAHNQDVLVKEGQQIKTGQKIARMGDSGTDRVKLHFEIRRDGEPVPPLNLLPKK